MIVRIANLLDARTLGLMREKLAAADWEDGRRTAGGEAVKVKQNEQITENHPVAIELGELVLNALAQSNQFTSAALPLKVFPPLFNRYSGGGHFGAHIDTAVRLSKQPPYRVRTDLSATLFLAEPDSYDGGELVVEDTYGEQRIKFAAGDMVMYPGTSVHRVEPVTRGERLACFFWVESMVRADAQRRLLYDMDMAITALRQRERERERDGASGSVLDGVEGPEVVKLTGCYHNLLRMWADV